MKSVTKLLLFWLPLKLFVNENITNHHTESLIYALTIGCLSKRLLQKKVYPKINFRVTYQEQNRKYPSQEHAFDSCDDELWSWISNYVSPIADESSFSATICICHIDVYFIKDKWG